MNILGNPTATKNQLLSWVKTKNPNQLAIDLLDLYWHISVDNGVNPVVVYCQSMKETGYLRFGGVLNASFKNPCGLKNPSGGDCYDPNAHKTFDSWSKGILAQVEHLALYAGKSDYPLKDTVDPRHFPYLKGKCPTVESLGGSWAPSSDYGHSLVRMCDEVKSMKVEEEVKGPITIEDALVIIEREVLELKTNISKKEEEVAEIKLELEIKEEERLEIETRDKENSEKIAEIKKILE